MSDKRKALITGITGQDGSYLAELLLAKDYRVFGLERRNSQRNRNNIEHLLGTKPGVDLVSGDLQDGASLVHALLRSKPDEVYNLAAQSFVGESWNQPLVTGDITGLGAARLLEAIRQVNPSIRFYQASSSEMFGAVKQSPQDETTPFYPRSPYGVAKLYAHWITVNYRESHRLYAVSGILFNHESPRRGIEFVTKKIARTAARIAFGLERELPLGDLTPRRDWGYAPDYVIAMWLMLQQKKPRDLVIATGETHSVRDFVDLAFAQVNVNSDDYVRADDYVRTDKSLLRPAEVRNLCGNARLAKQVLGWEPKVNFAELVGLMVEHEMQVANRVHTLEKEGV